MGLIIVFNNYSITVSAVTSVATQPPSYIIILCKKKTKTTNKQTFHIPLGPGDALRNFFFL